MTMTHFLYFLVHISIFVLGLFLFLFFSLYNASKCTKKILKVWNITLDLWKKKYTYYL